MRFVVSVFYRFILSVVNDMKELYPHCTATLGHGSRGWRLVGSGRECSPNTVQPLVIALADSYCIQRGKPALLQRSDTRTHLTTVSKETSACIELLCHYNSSRCYYV